MLYSEFLKGTRAPETPDTYDQFQIIGQIYEDCEGMTKEEAYRIWKQTYGRELKRRELRQRERLELLINREDYSATFGRQIILITHNADLAEIGEVSLAVKRSPSGESEVSVL